MTSQQQRWRDIASAPRDGSAVLAYWPRAYLKGHSRYDDGADKQGCPLVSYWAQDEDGGYWVAADGDIYSYPPTHWRELPEPPCISSPRATGESDDSPSA